MVLYPPGNGAGSEQNNELCQCIPGPASKDTIQNEICGNGEGFVNVHRGIQGISNFD